MPDDDFIHRAEYEARHSELQAQINNLANKDDIINGKLDALSLSLNSKMDSIIQASLQSKIKAWHWIGSTILGVIAGAASYGLADLVAVWLQSHH